MRGNGSLEKGGSSEVMGSAWLPNIFKIRVKCSVAEMSVGSRRK